MPGWITFAVIQPIFFTVEGECASSGAGNGEGVREIREWGLEGECASSGGYKIHSLRSCIFSLPRGRCL